VPGALNEAKAKEKKMSLRQQQKQIIEVKVRISELVDEVAGLKSELKFFREAVARDMKKALQNK